MYEFNTAYINDLFEGQVLTFSLTIVSIEKVKQSLDKRRTEIQLTQGEINRIAFTACGGICRNFPQRAEQSDRI